MPLSRCVSPHRLMLLIIVSLLQIQPLSAQVTARVAGTVRDPSGSVVVGVTVTALNTETGVRQTSTTDERGSYAFPGLAVGHYELNATQRGFKDYRQTGLTLDVNTALKIDITLQLGSQTERVTVNTAAVQVETTNTQMGEVITGTKMTTVPLNGRSYTDLLALQPGVARSPQVNMARTRCSNSVWSSSTSPTTRSSTIRVEISITGPSAT
jgi:hypothetical protein